MINIPLALRLVACGLAKFTLIGEDSGLCGFDCNGWEVELEVGDTADYERIRYQCVQTDDGPRLLPDTSDSLLLGWIVAEIECVSQKQVGVYQSSDCPTWWACMDFADAEQCFEGETRLEALVSALEAALAAGKVAQ